jgi:hypothetical protein
MIIGIALIARLVTRATEDSGPADTDRQMLTAINDLNRKGDLSQEEFRSIKKVIWLADDMQTRIHIRLHLLDQTLKYKLMCVISGLRSLLPAD